MKNTIGSFKFHCSVQTVSRGFDYDCKYTDQFVGNVQFVCLSSRVVTYLKQLFELPSTRKGMQAT